MAERAPRSAISPRREGAWSIPSRVISAAPAANAIWVPDPSPACAGMAEATFTS